MPPRESIKDGWFSTGDIGVVDEDGYYYVVDRKKDLIIRGGYNVYPREVEEALHEHPAVAGVVVIGIPHESLGEEVGAAVVLKAAASIGVEELTPIRERTCRRLQVPAPDLVCGQSADRPDGEIAAPRSQTTTRGGLTLW